MARWDVPRARRPTLKFHYEGEPLEIGFNASYPWRSFAIGNHRSITARALHIHGTREARHRARLPADTCVSDKRIGVSSRSASIRHGALRAGV